MGYSQLSSWRRYLILFLGSVAMLAVVFVYYQKISGYYQVDFSAYYAAAVSLSRGENPYSNSPEFASGQRFEHSQFLQSPIVARFFRPFAWLPYHQAKTLWLVVQFLLIVAVIALQVRDPVKTVIVANVLLISVPLLFWPIYAHFERGQTDLLVLFFIACSKFFWDRKNSGLAGALLAFGAILKLPTAFIFLVPLAVKDRKFVMGGVVSVALLLFVSVAIDGAAINQAYFLKYLPSIGSSGKLPVEVYDSEQQQSGLRAGRYIWDGREYAVAMELQAARGALRILNPVSGILGFLLSTSMIIFFLRRNDSAASRKIAWAFAMLSVLLFHPISWVMNYVWLLFIALALLSLIQDNLGGYEQYPKIMLYGIVLGGLLLIGMGDSVGTLIRQVIVWINDLWTHPWEENLIRIVNACLTYRVRMGGLILWLFLLGIILRWRRVP